MSEASSAKARTANAAPATPVTHSTLVGSLAQFFVGATPVRLPARVETENGATEQVVIEFGTPEEVIFASALPLEFGDRLKISNSDGSFLANVEVVAVQFHAGEAAIAARFSERVSNWIVKS